MTAPPAEATPLPTLHDLGLDLRRVSRWHVALSIGRPLAAFAAYWIFAAQGWWIAAGGAVAALLFLTYTSSSHDFVHRTLGLSASINEWLLAACEALAWRSGHVFRLTHLHHHRRFPAGDDVEAAGATGSFWSALAAGPGHQVRLIRWAWHHANPTERRWIVSELAVACSGVSAAVTMNARVPSLAVFAILVIGGSWFYPLATVWWPHRRNGTTALTQTRGFRGRLIPALFLQHTYHLEHHLYPAVASHHWAELGRRLEPHLRRAGVAFVRLP